MTLGQWYHTLKGLDVGKCHTKFQLCSPEGIRVINCKRNVDVNLHLNLQHITSWQNAICLTPAKAGGGIKKYFNKMTTSLVFNGVGVGGIKILFHIIY